MMILEPRLPEPFTVEFLGSELPESIASRFPQRPDGSARFVVTVEPEQTEEQKLDALRRDIQEGLDDSRAGRVVDGATVFAELRARFPGV